MDEGFIVDLPPEVNSEQFTVYAPEGGLRESLIALDEGAIPYLDLDIRLKFSHARLRIYPGGNIDQDGRNPLRYYVSDGASEGVAVFLDELGNEHSENYSFGGSIWTETIRAGSPTGVLNLWRQSFPEFNFNAAS